LHRIFFFSWLQKTFKNAKMQNVFLAQRQEEIGDGLELPHRLQSLDC
jgi:hypothetical protein